jgi:hypothetical protein
MGVSRDLNGMIMELVWLQANTDYLQEWSILLANNKSIQNDDIRTIVLDGGDN